MNGSPTPLLPERDPIRRRDDRLFDLLASGQVELRDALRGVSSELSGLRSELAELQVVPRLLTLLVVGMAVTLLLVGIVGGATVAVQTWGFSASVH